MRFPSGEKRGSASRLGPCVSGFAFFPLASIDQILNVPLRSLVKMIVPFSVAASSLPAGAGCVGLVAGFESGVAGFSTVALNEVEGVGFADLAAAFSRRTRRSPYGSSPKHASANEGVSLKRYAARHFSGGDVHAPPRRMRLSPVSGPRGFSLGELA